MTEATNPLAALKQKSANEGGNFTWDYFGRETVAPAVQELIDTGFEWYEFGT